MELELVDLEDSMELLVFSTPKLLSNLSNVTYDICEF